MKFMYQLSTNTLFCSESKLIFSEKGSSLPVDGLLSITGDPNKFSRVNNFSLKAGQIVCCWKE